MAEYKDREHYIPLRQTDLVDLLCNELRLDRSAVEQLRQLNTLLSATFHYEYYRLLEDLKDEYAPFDPDSVTRPIRQLGPEERAKQLDLLVERFAFLMERANFKRLTLDEFKEQTAGVSDWGLNMDVDFKLFERFDVFVRGDFVATRSLRRWYRFFQSEEIRVPTYRRMVLFLKLKPSRRVPREVSTDSVFLKIFKDIPKADMEMLLPGARLMMPSFDRWKMGGSLFGGGGWIAYTIAADFLKVAELGATMFFAPLAAVGGFGYKQWHAYQTTRTAFGLRLAQSLYYQTLGSNLSVLFHLLDEAEEQECREALLAYFYLWRFAGQTGWTASSLDDYVEMDLERLVNLKVDFEIEDALAKLERLKLVSKVENRYVALPIEQALEALDEAWDGYFKYNVSEKIGR
jgi:hypothetical protein